MDIKFHITLVRHGQTLNNCLRLIQGQHLDASLNAKGKSQSIAVARFLKNELFTHIYCSDMWRSIETCEYIINENEHKNSSSDVKYHTDNRLRERCMGVMDGRPIADLKRMAFIHNQHRRVFTPEDGETLDELSQRVDSFFRSLCLRIWRGKGSDSERKEEENVLIVSHSGTIRALVLVLGQKYGCNIPGDLLDLKCGNTSRSNIDVELSKEATSSSDEVDDNFTENLPFAIKANCNKLFNVDHLKQPEANMRNENASLNAYYSTYY